MTAVAITGVAVTALATILAAFPFSNRDDKPGACQPQSVDAPGQGCMKELVGLFNQGKKIFRFDTFGDEDYVARHEHLLPEHRVTDSLTSA